MWAVCICACRQFLIGKHKQHIQYILLHTLHASNKLILTDHMILPVFPIWRDAGRVIQQFTTIWFKRFKEHDSIYDKICLDEMKELGTQWGSRSAYTVGVSQFTVC